jgi:DNA-binding CsgD family transcriptional regulator
VRSGGRSYQQAEEMVVAALASLGGAEPDLVAELETELALSLRIGTGPGRPSPSRVEELAAIASGRGDEPTSRLLRLAALGLQYDPTVGPVATALAAEAVADAVRTELADVGAYYRIYVYLIAADEMDVVLSTVDATVEAARRSGRLTKLAVAATIRARAYMRVGRLQEAEQDGRLADRVAVGLGGQERRFTFGPVVQCLVERGRVAEADDELGASGVPMTLGSLLKVRARLRLAQDRPGEALADLEECGRWHLRRRVLHPNVVSWQPWTAVALLRLGREQEAREQAAEALTRAREFGSARAEGLALWASGLVERSPGLLADAVTVLGTVQAPLERARALVDLGAALRRANRRAEARGPLGEGLQLAHRCGAVPIVETARLELAAAGVNLRRPAVSGPDALTPTERRIAELAAEGASNRHIAQTLFVSPKTVENHLGSVYRKLAVGGRAALPDALALQD